MLTRAYEWATTLLARGFSLVIAVFLSEWLGEQFARLSTPDADPEEEPVLRAADAPPTAEDLRWQKRVDDLSFDALTNIRSAAEKWAGSIAALTGVFGIFALVKGKDDLTKLEHSWQIAIGIILAVASYFALRAILLAAIAAQGSAHSRDISVANIRDEYAAAATTAAGELRSSRVLVVLATCLVGLAIGMTWFGPESAESPALTLIATKGGDLLCGSLGVDSTGSLTVTSPTDESVVKVALASVQVMTGTPRCPS